VGKTARGRIGRVEDVRAGDRRRARWGAVLVTLTLGVAACSAGAAAAHRLPAPVRSGRPGAAARPAPVVDPARVHADELGVVPVLMYHQLVAHPAGDYDQTPAQFRTELTQLYAHHFRTITAGALADRRIDLPAGTSPMVLTFDDSTVSQYAELPDGRVAPNCAVGILLSVARAYGELHPVASFYVNARPFGGRTASLRTLAHLGMELGDHTATHANLGRLDAGDVQRELARGQVVITSAVRGAPVSTMALPYGVLPHNRALAHAGESAGTSYEFRGVLLVGAGPAGSPYAKGFAPEALPRIRSGRRTDDQRFTSTYWLRRLFIGAVRPYVSDGDPGRISFPKAVARGLERRFAALARPY